MNIQSLLCSQQQTIKTTPQSLYCNTSATYHDMKTTVLPLHQRQTSWTSTCSSASTSSPTSPTSASYYSIPSSPEIESNVTNSTTTTTTTTTDTITAATVTNTPVHAVNANTNTNRGHSQTRTPWSSEEDQLLQQGYSQGLSWAMISTVYLPHRSRGCCWGRFKTLQAKSLEHKEWSESEDRLLSLAIKKNSRLFKQAWKSVAQDMGNNRNWKECELRSTKVQSHAIKKRQSPTASIHQ